MLDDVRAGLEACRKYESKDVGAASELLPWPWPCTATAVTSLLLLSSSVVKSDARESELARTLLRVEGVTVESNSE
jgi:hypothetical protein